jgi:membrane fusion protein, multidrug efflux system
MQYLQTKTTKESLEKKMSVLKEQMELTKIVSPINGTVDAVDVKLGQLVAPGVPAMRVVNFSNVKVKADVAESYASKIKKGAEVLITFPDAKDSLSTKINFVSRTINSSTRSFALEVLLDDKKEYFPNMVATLHINDYQSAKPVIIVPVKALQKDDINQSFVFVAEKNSAKKRIVTLGKEFNGKIEITGGLKEGDLLITEGYNIVNENDAIAYKK